MRRKLFTLAAGVSAVLCAGACVLWVRSYKSPDRFSGLRGGDRYTLVSADGRLTLFGPPQGLAAPRDAADLVVRLRNADVRWTALSRPAIINGTYHPYYHSLPGPVNLKPGSAGEKLDAGGFGLGNARLLLAALERPDAFVAAHVLLTRGLKPPSTTPAYGGQGQWMWERDSGEIQPDPKPDRVAWGQFYGLRAMIRLTDRGGRWSSHAFGAWVDTTQIPALRDQWHRRLDVVVWSVRNAWAAAATGVLPLLWTNATFRRNRQRMRRQRLELCLACGYDLRYSPKACPECGAVPRVLSSRESLLPDLPPR